MVDWQSESDLDSIRNSCNVFPDTDLCNTIHLVVVYLFTELSHLAFERILHLTCFGSSKIHQFCSPGPPSSTADYVLGLGNNAEFRFGISKSWFSHNIAGAGKDVICSFVMASSLSWSHNVIVSCPSEVFSTVTWTSSQLSIRQTGDHEEIIIILTIFGKLETMRK